MNAMTASKMFFYSLILMFATSVAYADPHGGVGEGHKSMSKHGHGEGHKKGHGGKKSRTFSPHWTKTLSDEQKVSFDKMHLLVGQFEAVQRAKVKMLKKELRVLVAQKPSDKKAMYAKIDEIMEVKKAIMRNRFDHIVEMRGELTEQQRISYDMDLLKRKKHKH